MGLSHGICLQMQLLESIHCHKLFFSAVLFSNRMQVDRGNAGSDSSEDPIQAALDHLVDPWALDPDIQADCEADDAADWFARMDPAELTAASAAKAAAFAALDDQFADAGVACNDLTLCSGRCGDVFS